MTKAGPQDMRLAKEARMVAVVMIATMVLWLAAQWLGGRAGWEIRYAFLFDLAALAAFIWAMAVIWRIRQRQKRPEGK
ncbi:MAG: DUF5337 domain-containing protein [Rhodobacteraceae bacterium]|nr:DUF5337 domain-containing protein [Paracoccaceae bacterium]